VSESASESGDEGVGLGLAALIGADIVEEGESGSDFEPSDDDPADSSNDDESTSSATSGDKGSPGKDRGTGEDGSDEEEEDEEVNSNSYSSSSRERNDQTNESENEISDSVDDEGIGNHRGKKKRKLGDISEVGSTHNNNDESSECGE